MLCGNLMGGVVRSSWARNEHFMETCVAFHDICRGEAHITIHFITNEDMMADLAEKKIGK